MRNGEIACYKKFLFFSSPEYEVLRVSYFDHSPSVVVSLSDVRPFPFPCLHSSIYKYQSINTKHDQNVCDY